MVQPHSSNFRVITTNFLGVQIHVFRKFTVINTVFITIIDRLRNHMCMATCTCNEVTSLLVMCHLITFY